jgi:hypothetical protein
MRPASRIAHRQAVPPMPPGQFGDIVLGEDAMAPRVRSAKLETCSARLRLPRGGKPYSVPIMRGVHLLYRRNKTAGPFMVRVCRGGQDWTEPLGIADDYDEADGKNVLTYW